jgi:hypothetical protein
VLEVTPYEDAHDGEWNAFVSRSKNGTFLFQRAYMDYHADRFPDRSLIVRDGRTIRALLPAAGSGDVLSSHDGLTYGGLVTDSSMTQTDMVEVFERVLSYLRESGVRRLSYKTVPAIYHRVPAEEDRYSLFLAKATLVRRDVLTVIDTNERGPVQERRRRARRRAESAGIEVRASNDFEAFWAILAENLARRHAVSPVHSLAEIRLLAQRFPDEIGLRAAYGGDRMVAGAVVYVSPRVCHVQYNAVTAENRRTGAMDAILEALYAEYVDSVRYFDFGVSTEDAGRHLNTGLVEYKSSFGGGTVVHDFYELDLT